MWQGATYSFLHSQSWASGQSSPSPLFYDPPPQLYVCVTLLLFSFFPSSAAWWLTNASPLPNSAKLKKNIKKRRIRKQPVRDFLFLPRAKEAWDGKASGVFVRKPPCESDSLFLFPPIFFCLNLPYIISFLLFFVSLLILNVTVGLFCSVILDAACSAFAFCMHPSPHTITLAADTVLWCLSRCHGVKNEIRGKSQDLVCVTWHMRVVEGNGNHWEKHPATPSAVRDEFLHCLDSATRMW